MKASKLEALLELQLQSEGIAFEREYHAIHDRKFRWDFAFPEAKLLVEIQGGIWLGRNGAHSSGNGLARDYEKNNLAVIAGWRVMYFHAQHIRSGDALDMIKAFLSARINH